MCARPGIHAPPWATNPPTHSNTLRPHGARQCSRGQKGSAGGHGRRSTGRSHLVKGDANRRWAPRWDNCIDPYPLRQAERSQQTAQAVNHRVRDPIAGVGQGGGVRPVGRSAGPGPDSVIPERRTCLPRGALFCPPGGTPRQKPTIFRLAGVTYTLGPLHNAKHKQAAIDRPGPLGPAAYPKGPVIVHEPVDAGDGGGPKRLVMLVDVLVEDGGRALS